VNEPELFDIYEAAVRAAINQRCASAYAHDLRGSMQALFGALELLCRSAKCGSEDPVRVERACELARRAISHHERTTLDLVQRLTFQPSEPLTPDPGVLVGEIVHLLRNEAGANDMVIRVSGMVDVSIPVERGRLHALLMGILTARLDAGRPGAELQISIDHRDGFAIIGIHSKSVPEQAAESTRLGRRSRKPWVPN
jgi:signal transduction histidine kinase